MLFISYGILIVYYVISINGKWVIDVDSSIKNEIQNNPTMGYLIKFHAPWCGHCRHFEPIYEEIAKEVNELSMTDDDFKNIRVVRVDATVHSDVANYYDIRGYPTVKFIRGSQIISYENERTKSAVINFLRRVNGPSIRWISTIENFNEVQNEHDVFFLLVATSEDDQLVKDYNDIVNRYLSQAYFYATNQSIIQETFFSNYNFDDQSQLFAVKKKEFYLYLPNEYNNSLDEFILKEKVVTFPEVSSGNMYDLVLTQKIIVIYGHDKNDEKSDEIKSRIYNYIIKHNSNIHHTFQFAWSNDLDLLSHIAVWTLEGPVLFLYDSVQRKYGIYSLTTPIGKTIDVESILNNVTSNPSEIIRHTGHTFSKRLFRPFWELSRTLTSMFTEAPLMSMLLIGVPASLLSVICYCLCCLGNETSMNDPDLSYEMIKNNQLMEDEDEDEDDGDDDNEQLKSTIKPDEEQKPMTEKKED